MKIEGISERILEESQIRYIAATKKVPYELIEMANVFIFNFGEENFLFKNRGKKEDVIGLYNLDYITIGSDEYDRYIEETKSPRNGITAEIFVRDKLSKTADIDMILDLKVNIIYRCEDNEPLLIPGIIRKVSIQSNDPGHDDGFIEQLEQKALDALGIPEEMRQNLHSTSNNIK